MRTAKYERDQGFAAGEAAGVFGASDGAGLGEADGAAEASGVAEGLGEAAAAAFSCNLLPRPTSPLFPWITLREIEVTMKIPAAAYVSLPRSVVAPVAPRSPDDEPPPNAAPTPPLCPP